MNFEWTLKEKLKDTLECRYSAVQYGKILHEWLQALMQNINQMPDPQKTPHKSP